MSNSFEGLTIEFDKDFTLEITPKLRKIDLGEYDLKCLKFKYEHHTCGCCEGNHELVEIKPQDLFEFVDSGGIKEIDKLKKEIKDLENKKEELEKKIKQFKGVFKTIEESDTKSAQNEPKTKDGGED